ncbi:MAG TPA: TatD family hydrolase [Polyangiaceae bacterium]|nr:TatD family hydrolase [Polyangiaceae bacterium]
MTPAGLIDIGANLTNKAFGADLDAVLARAAGAGVGGILVTGTSAAGSRRAREIVVERRALAAPRLYATAGIHPHQASSASREALAEIRELARREQVVAVGECGLDYNRDFSPRDRQRACFEAQLEIASEAKKPVFLHERDAAEDFARVLERHRPRLAGGVVHCFTGARAALERYLGLDLYIGITGWICDERRGAHLRQLVRLVPEGRLLVETDAPYLLPRDLARRPAGGRNEPALLAHVARAVASCRGETLEQLTAHTTAAAARLFGL